MSMRTRCTGRFWGLVEPLGETWTFLTGIGLGITFICRGGGQGERGVRVQEKGEATAKKKDPFNPVAGGEGNGQVLTSEAGQAINSLLNSEKDVVGRRPGFRKSARAKESISGGDVNSELRKEHRRGWLGQERIRTEQESSTDREERGRPKGKKKRKIIS